MNVLKRKKRNHLFNIFHIGIKKDRFELYNKINNRVDEMLKNGLLNEVKSLIKFKDSNVLILGVTFKEDCPDMRNTKVIGIIEELKDFGINVDVYDPWVAPGL